MDEGAGKSLAALHAAVDELLVAEWDRMGDVDVLDVWRGLEAVARRLAAVDHAVIGQVSSRRLDHRYGARSVVALAREVLRIGAGEAKARVDAAEAAGQRVGLSGEVLPPVFEEVAAAQRAGEIGPVQARIVVTAVEKLPEAVAAEHGAWLEDTLVEHAAAMDSDRLRALAAALTYQLDQDGQLHDAASRERRRDLRVIQRAEGRVGWRRISPRRPPNGSSPCSTRSADPGPRSRAVRIRALPGSGGTTPCSTPSGSCCVPVAPPTPAV